MKALELTVYPKVDRWVPWSVVNYKGETVTGSRREHGYETPLGVFEGDAHKRLTDAELAAEFWKAKERCMLVSAFSGMSPLPDSTLARQSIILHRFATLPHYDEPQPQEGQ